MLELSSEAYWALGILLIAILAIELGGNYVLALTRGKEEGTEFQKTFARAGHGHAGSVAILGMVTVLLTDTTGLSGFWEVLARWAVPAAAVVMPAGFFLSSMGKNRTEANGLMVLIYVGAILLGIGLVTLAVGLFGAAIQQ